MKRWHKILSVAVCFMTTPGLFAQQKQIIGYYPSWRVGHDTVSLRPDKIQYEKFSMINFAFLYPTSEGGIKGLDTLATSDNWILYGDRDNSTGKLVPGTSLADRSHEHNVKVMASIGGWGGSMDFPQIAASPQKRQRFAGECVRTVRNYGLDGIDIDWEFPGYAPHNGKPEDKKNFTFLLQVIRDSLDVLEKSSGKKCYLTAALPAGEFHASQIEVLQIVPLLDYLNIMTYDFANPWSDSSGHNSPLYGDRGSVDASFRYYHEKHGVPANKINLGAPFYGYAYKNCSTLGSKHDGPDTQHFRGGEAPFNVLAGVRELYKREWDQRAKVPYFVIPPNTLVSYDDEESIRLKAQYVLDSGAAGLIVWEITADALSGGSTPLLDIVYRTFRKE